MATDNLNRSSTIRQPDILSALLSNLTVVIQIIAVGAIGLADVLNIKSLFQFEGLVTLANFIVLILSFSSIGIYNFYKANKNFVANTTKPGLLQRIKNWLIGEKVSDPLSNSGEKFLLKLLFLLLAISSGIFFYLTYKGFPRDGRLNEIEGFVQLFTYITTLVTSSILIYIWIRDAFDKSSRFTENSFVPNLRSTLIEYGHVKTPSIRIHQNIDIGNGNRLLKVTTDDKLKYFVVTYDGSRINAEITKEQYNKFFEGQPSQKTEK